MARPMPTAPARCSTGSIVGMVDREPGGVHGSSTPARRARVIARVPSAPASSTTRGVAGGDPRRGRVEGADRRLAADGVLRGHGPALGSSPSRSTTSPGRSSYDHAPIGMSSIASTRSSNAAAGVCLGRARGGEEQLDRLGRREVLVVAMGDLSDADDDREAPRSRGGAAVEHDDRARHVSRRRPTR